MNNPIIRFKKVDGSDFSDWKESSFQEIFEFRSSISLSRSQLNYTTGEIKNIHYGDILLKFPSIVHTDNKLIPYINQDCIPNKYDLLEKGDVVFADTAEDYSLGKAIEIGSTPFRITSGLHTIACKAKLKFASGFLVYYLNSNFYHCQINKLATGTKVYSIIKSNIIKTKLRTPSSLEEQQKIASFFSTLDQKIELNERKLEALEKLKKGLLKKIFDHEIRFKSADGGTYSSWNESSLGNYFSVKMCKRIFKEETSDIGEVPFFKIGTFGKTPDAYISKELFEKYRKNFNYPSINDTLISCSGTVGRCVLFDGKESYFQDSNIVWLEPIDKHLIYNKIYLYIVLSNLSWHELSSTTIKRIYSKDLLSKKWPIPCIEEQNKIASLFVLLDRKITLFSQRLQSLKKLKQGFMQQMFV